MDNHAWQGWVRRAWADLYREAHPGRLQILRAGPRAYLCTADTATVDHMLEVARQHPGDAGARRFLRDYE